MRMHLAMALAATTIGLSCLACQAGDAVKNARDTGRGVAFATVRGMTMPALAAAQHQQALANWKRLYSAETPPSFESQNFLLVGAVPGKTLKEIAPGLEKQFALARKTLEMEFEEAWPGKMAVYFFSER